MSFLYPIFIYLLIPLIMILFYFLMTGRREEFVMFEQRVLDQLRMQSKSLSRNARYMLYLMSFVFMILALAQPVIKEGEITVEAKSADILIGIDISDSMKAEDRYPNRLEFAKTKAISLIKQAPPNRIGVLAFAKHDYIVSPLSFDHASVAFLLSKVNTGNITEKGTRLDSMLHSAVSMLEHANQKNLLLFTDGGDREDFSEQIALAKEHNLRLFIIGVGTSKGSPVRTQEGDFVKHKGNILISRLNSEIKHLATESGGVYIQSVLGDEDIKAMLQEIESMSEKSTLKEEKIPQYTQLFYYPLALAIVFLLLAFSSFPKSMLKHFIVLFVLAAGMDEAKAGLLDFQKLQEAREAYDSGDYNTSKSLYSEFSRDSDEAVYNLGNVLYKEGAYEQALKVYERISMDKPDLKAQALYNSANARVKMKQYEQALASYEEALDIKEDTQTRENYEALKKFLQEQKQNKQENKSSQKDQEGQENQQQQDQQSNDEGNEQANKDNSDNGKGDSDEKGQGSGKTSEQKSNAAEDKEMDTSKQKRNEADKEAQKSRQDEANEQIDRQKSSEAQEGDNAGQEASEKRAVQMKQMSDLEAQKWMKLMQQSQQGHLYQMQTAEHKEDENEKPW